MSDDMGIFTYLSKIYRLTPLKTNDGAHAPPYVEEVFLLTYHRGRSVECINYRWGRQAELEVLFLHTGRDDGE
jgi:hypothetical protein